MFQKAYRILTLLIYFVPLSLLSQQVPTVFEGSQLLKIEKRDGISRAPNHRDFLTRRTERDLKDHFRDFTVYKFSPEKFQSFLASRGDTQRVVLNLGGEQWPMRLIANDLRKKSLRVVTRSRGALTASSPNIAYKGRVDLPGGGPVRISLGANGLMGFATLNGEKTFFESLQAFSSENPKDAIIAYKESALMDTAFSCAVTQASAYADHVRDQVESRAVCPNYYELEIATIATFERYLAQGGTVNGVNDHIIGLLNLVEANYEPFKVKFQITEQQVIDCDDCEPWGETDNIQELLSSFSSWAPGGFNASHDVGICFFRGAGSGTVGYAWIRAVCNSNFRYSVVDQLFSTTGNRVLIAHELGHNFGSNHDQSGSPYIMAPSVNSGTEFSAQSTTAMINHIESRTCLECIDSTDPCVPPVASFNTEQAACEEEVGKITFTFVDQSGDKNFEFSLDGGSTYPYSAPDNARTLEVPNITPGTYSLRIREVGTTCMSDLGNTTISRLPSPTASFTTVAPSCGNTDGSMTFFFDDVDNRTQMEFSLDGGDTFPYSVADDADSLRIEDLGMGTYRLWVRWGDDSCPTGLDTLQLDEVSTLAVCDDQDPNTIDDRFDENCVCKGRANQAEIRVSALFEGFYSPAGDSMTTQLSELNLIPLVQPYNANPFVYEGGESIATVPNNLVDWVLLELRDSLDINQVLARQAAWISSRGELFSIAGTPILTFDGIPAGHYFLALYHQGHLGVISTNPIPFDSSAPVYDFTASEDRARGREQLKLIGNRYCLFAGDFDGNGILNNLDFNRWRQNPSAINQYLPIDADGNGIINNLDFNLWSANGSKLGDAAVQK